MFGLSPRHDKLKEALIKFTWRIALARGARSSPPFGGVRGGPEVDKTYLIGGGVNPVSIMKMAFECLKSRWTPPSKTKIERVASPPLTQREGKFSLSRVSQIRSW